MAIRFDNDTDYGGGSFLRETGDFFFRITAVEYDSQYFEKYNIDLEVVTGPFEGSTSRGQITKPTEKYMNDNDRALGGFSYSQLGKYIAGAGIADQVNALPKITVGAVGKMLVGKIIKARNQPTKKSLDKISAGETDGIFYEIGKVYRYNEWTNDEMEAAADFPEPSPFVANSDTNLPFDMSPSPSFPSNSNEGKSDLPF